VHGELKVESPVRIETKRLVLALPPLAAAPRLAAFFLDNAEHLARWEPPRPATFTTDAWWRERLALDAKEHETGQSVRLAVFAKEDVEGPVIGVCNFSRIARGPFLACNLGYSIAQRHEGKGLMREALTGAIDHMFSVVGLHRIQANYVPTNERSGGLLRSLGFVVEGYARDYLFIAGAWRDHVLTSLTNPRPVTPVA
jgi:ribosomal-protein-alanine N-acetyltransferase